MKHNSQTYCGRHGGAEIKGKFHPLPTAQQFLASQLERSISKKELRQAKRMGW